MDGETDSRAQANPDFFDQLGNILINSAKEKSRVLQCGGKQRAVVVVPGPNQCFEPPVK